MQQLYWNPMREVAEAERRFSSLLHNGLSHKLAVRNGSMNWTPAVDISENAEAFMFTMELPGMTPETVDIEVKGKQLTIKGERPAVEAKEGVQVHHRERPSGRFARVFQLHKAVDAEKVTATYRDGLLEVIVPLHAETKPRKIAVAGN
jgi:HSP20 family protein